MGIRPTVQPESPSEILLSLERARQDPQIARFSLNSLKMKKKAQKKEC